MNMMTSMSLLLKTITFVACISLRSTFTHELRGSIFVEAIQSFNEPDGCSLNHSSSLWCRWGYMQC